MENKPPITEQTCDTCKFEECFITRDPCKRCLLDFENHWEPKDKKEIKNNGANNT